MQRRSVAASDDATVRLSGVDGMKRKAGRIAYWMAVVLVALGLVIGVLLLTAPRDAPSLKPGAVPAAPG